MKKFLMALSLCMSFSMFYSFAEANHCSGGHKEIKETKETDSEDSKEAKSN